MSDEAAMPDQVPLPTSFDQWHHCITVRCKLHLTRRYIHDRLRELTNIDDPKTKEFTRLYGDEHRQRVIAWFRQAFRELPEQGGAS